PSDRGYASYFAHLRGIERLPKLRRLEGAPYATTRNERIDPRGATNPFNDGSRQVAGAGLDAEYGITTSLTLDATLNPDFGHVGAQPPRRPVGAPQGSAAAHSGFVDLPDHATILGAGKITGRVGPWSMALLEAST